MSAAGTTGSTVARAPLEPVEVAPAYHPTAGTVDLGAVPTGTSMTVAVGLPLQDPTGLTDYLRLEYAAGTPSPQRFLSSSELAERYGATPVMISSAASYFAGQGLEVSASPDHLLLFVSGPSATLGRAFGTSFERYRAPSGQVYFDHATPAFLPPTVAWTGVLGLSDLSAAAPESIPEAVQPLAGPGAACTAGFAGLSPCQVWNAYDLSPLLANGTNGSGLRIGVVDAYSGDEGQEELTHDLSVFASDFGLPGGNVQFLYPVPGPTDLNSSGVNPDWDAEDALDLEWARAAAPGASIDFTFSPNAGIGLYEAVDWLVAHQAVNVISLSWGEPDVGVFNAYNAPCLVACNASTDGTYAILGPVLQFAAAEGISVFAATGDCGASDGTSGVSTNYPASDPSVTGVGGTVLDVSSSGTYLGEQAWSGNHSGAAAPGCQNQGGSGGGYAPFPRPWWQTGLGTGTTFRGVPDVSIVGGTAATIILRGEPAGVLGTSLATPIWAGIAADIGQHAGQPLGFLDPALYRVLNGPSYSTDFHDITSGSNGYPAGPGWDAVTGIGSPIVAALADNLTSQAPTPLSSLATNLSGPGSVGRLPLSVDFTFAARGGTGTYPLAGIYFGDGTAELAAPGTVAHTYTTPGVYAAQSYVVDSSGNWSASAPVLVVASGGLLAVSLSVSNRTPSAIAPVTLHVDVGGGTAAYRFAYYFGDGTFLNNSSEASISHLYAVPGSYCASVIAWDSSLSTSGGISAAVAVGVGGAPIPVCRASTPLLLVGGNASVERGTAPLAVNFTAQASGGVGLPYAYAWTFGDGSVGDGSQVVHTFGRAGTYRVDLTVADAAGDLANLTWVINVSAPQPAPSGVSVPLLVWLGIGLAAGAAIGALVAIRSRPRASPPPPPAASTSLTPAPPEPPAVTPPAPPPPPGVSP